MAKLSKDMFQKKVKEEKTPTVQGPVRVRNKKEMEEARARYNKLRQEWDETEQDRVVTFLNRKFDLSLPLFKGYLHKIKEEEGREYLERHKKYSVMRKEMTKLESALGILPDGQKTPFEIMTIYKDQILEMLGKDLTATEISIVLKKKGEKVHPREIRKFQLQHYEEVQDMRKKWREDLSDLSISVKKSRLNKLNYLLIDLYELYKNAGLSMRLNISKEIRGILEQARKEVEGEELKLTVSGKIDVEATINHYMRDSGLLQGLTIQQLVISRISSRLGLNSQYFMDRLAYSFYAKWNGFRKNDDLKTKPIYPSASNYDILDLERKSKDLVEHERQKYPQAEDAVIVEDNTVRQNLLKALKRIGERKELSDKGTTS